MISTSDFEKGMILNMDSEYWIIVDFQFVNPGKGAAFVKTKLKNLKTGKYAEKTFKSGEEFEEAKVEKIKAKFLYFHRDKFFFSKEGGPSFRFDVSREAIGAASDFLKVNQIVDGILLAGEIINISLPIKVFLKVTEAPPGIKGDSVQGGTKTVTLETGVVINVPLFIEEGDVIEVNTEKGEYVRRVE